VLFRSLAHDHLHHARVVTAAVTGRESAASLLLWAFGGLTVIIWAVLFLAASAAARRRRNRRRPRHRGSGTTTDLPDQYPTPGTWYPPGPANWR
jgi:hypothetical protein